MLRAATPSVAAPILSRSEFRTRLGAIGALPSGFSESTGIKALAGLGHRPFAPGSLEIMAKSDSIEIMAKAARISRERQCV
jgi:hypothetical protein